MPQGKKTEAVYRRVNASLLRYDNVLRTRFYQHLIYSGFTKRFLAPELTQRCAGNSRPFQAVNEILMEPRNNADEKRCAVSSLRKSLPGDGKSHLRIAITKHSSCLAGYIPAVVNAGIRADEVTLSGFIFKGKHRGAGSMSRILRRNHPGLDTRR
ncbi:hypothetical protein [Kosakonia sacchari]|uniref:Uncharacterized protein n=1 Tax=Kosakonia sacchari TaxID=1158459 RepID=A0ABZ0MU42_9ENTR|nr:hypothetical protein [Kosakonia sacchari]WOZ79030.1 hypothetical protein Q8Y70_08250 [Kosakonia sacchari]